VVGAILTPLGFGLNRHAKHIDDETERHTKEAEKAVAQHSKEHDGLGDAIKVVEVVCEANQARTETLIGNVMAEIRRIDGEQHAQDRALDRLNWAGAQIVRPEGTEDDAAPSKAPARPRSRRPAS